jgi:TM2 domain-containing membrane protein YozV
MTRQRQTSRWLAAVLSIVPGLGHIYLGEWRKGLFFLLSCGGLEFLGLDLDLTVIGELLGVPLGIGGFGLWAFSVWDAYRIARNRDRLSRGGTTSGSPHAI